MTVEPPLPPGSEAPLSEVAPAGQMSEQAARAKRLFNGERWAEALGAMDAIARGDGGDDLGNRQIAEYHAAICAYRLGDRGGSLQRFLAISGQPSHHKFKEVLYWLARFLDQPDHSERALEGIAHYATDHVAPFNNPQQFQIHALLTLALAKVALRQGRLDDARALFAGVPNGTRAYAAATECLRVHGAR